MVLPLQIKKQSKGGCVTKIHFLQCVIFKTWLGLHNQNMNFKNGCLYSRLRLTKVPGYVQTPFQVGQSIQGTILTVRSYFPSGKH